MRKKILAVLLVVAVIGMIPVTAISTTMVAESHEISVKIFLKAYDMILTIQI